MNGARQTLTDRIIRAAVPLIFLAVLLVFGAMEPGYLSAGNLTNIVKQAAFIGIAAVGMVFVLLTAGIDLSVGSVMYLAPLLAGFFMRETGLGVFPGLLVAILAGMAMGAINGFFIVRLKIIPFIVTLSTLFFFRGAGTFMTSSRQFDFSRDMLDFGLTSLAGIPLPIIVLAIVAAAAHVVLTRTTFGRQVYAVGADAEAARKAGINVGSVRFRVYVISSACAALAGFVLISQIGRLDQAFGEGREFDVIAAAVLGGASLFGGIGTVWSAIVGATLIQAVKTGLVFSGINLYLQPMLQGLVIFVAVLLDTLRSGRLAERMRRTIRAAGEPGPGRK
ncbi:ABC transporter permease [Chelativorans sp.]|uniref:ABC transporter permease n=1 Tax=Chelativorans sp. TaxID=2203393 RepID=UPI0028117A5B|nr:ABC transporter permease [Chelativorans sp.]